MEQNARQIDELRLKVEAKHSSVVTDKEIEARAKEQQLKGMINRILNVITLIIFPFSKLMKNVYTCKRRILTVSVKIYKNLFHV